jgi:hypothetical protein
MWPVKCSILLGICPLGSKLLLLLAARDESYSVHLRIVDLA